MGRELARALEGRGWVAHTACGLWLRLWFPMFWALVALFRLSRWPVFAALAEDWLGLGVAATLRGLALTAPARTEGG